MRRAMRVCLLFLLLLQSAIVNAITSAESLPKGVRAGAFVYGRGDGIVDAFNSVGQRRDFSSPLNQTLSLTDLSEFEPQVKELQNVLNSIGPHQLGERLLQVDLYSNISVSEQRYVTGFMWGISDRYSLGVVVPVVSRSYRANFSVETTSNVQDLKNMMGEIPGLHEALIQVENSDLSTEVFAENIFHKNGYQTPSDFSAGGLGDVEIEGRYQYLNSTYVLGQLRHNLRLPTATYTPDMSNLLDRPLGQENYSLRVSNLNDLKMIPHVLSLNTSISTTVHSVSQSLRAVKRDTSQRLPNLNDPYQVGVVNKYRGIDLGLESGLMLDVWRGAISLSGSYVYRHHLKDRHSGDRDLLYDELSENSDWELHSVEASFELSSVPLFLKNIAPVPARVMFTWHQPFAGRNTEFVPYGRIDVVLLF